MLVEMQHQGVDTQNFSFGFPEIFRRECDLRGTPGIRRSLGTPAPPIRLFPFTIRFYRGFHSARMFGLIPRVIGPHADANAGITFRSRCKAESRTISGMGHFVMDPYHVGGIGMAPAIVAHLRAVKVWPNGASGTNICLCVQRPLALTTPAAAAAMAAVSSANLLLGAILGQAWCGCSSKVLS